MVEIRIHGRGGQGAQVASHILARAALSEGKFGQAFAVFGGERRGAPVLAFVRVSRQPIFVKCQIYRPDHVLVLDQALTRIVNVSDGLKAGGTIVINSRLPADALAKTPGIDWRPFDGSSLAARHGLGTATTPVVNTVMLGAFCGTTGIIGLEALLEAVGEYVPAKAKDNLAACREAYDLARKAKA